MNNIYISAVLGYLTDFFGIGIGFFGAWCAYAFKKKYIKDAWRALDKNLFFSLIFEFSSGLMTAAVTFSLIPAAIDKCGVLKSVLVILCGLLFAYAADKHFGGDNALLKTGMLMIVNLWLHNIPEGFVLGMASRGDLKSAFLFFGAILLHNIPQGFIIFLPVISAGLKKFPIIMLVIFGGIPTALGALFGAYAGGISEMFTGTMLAFSAGSMLYVLIFELLYEAHRMYGGRIIETAYVLGLILGILIF